MSPLYRDRQDAGRRLADLLIELTSESPIVFGMVRGGVVVAEPVAERLKVPLYPLVVRKVGAPGNPEFGIGAVAPGGIEVRKEESLAMSSVDDATFDRLAKLEEEEVERRLDAYLGGRSIPSLNGRLAILVDDGLATGVSAIAAARFLHAQSPSKTVLAVPVGSKQGLDALLSEVDEIVCPYVPEWFSSVGQWYEHFGQTSDDEVLEALRQAEAALK